MQYTTFDKELVDEIYLKIYSTRGATGKIVKDATRYNVPFQFPPKVTSDGRRATWDEGGIVGTETISNVATPGPRILTVSWSYVVEIANTEVLAAGNQDFNIRKIRGAVNMMRGYFLTASKTLPAFGGWIVRFKYPWVAGWGPNKIDNTFRITDVSVKYSEEMVGSNKEYFPKQTDVTIDLRLWNQGAVFGANEDGEAQVVQDIDGLDATSSNPEDFWY
jgi:hypothetical protein